MSSAMWLRLTDLEPLYHAGLPEYGDVGEMDDHAHINADNGLIVARVASAPFHHDGRYELWCIPAGGRAVRVAVDHFSAHPSAPPDAPRCERTEKLLNVRAPF